LSSAGRCKCRRAACPACPRRRPPSPSTPGTPGSLQESPCAGSCRSPRSSLLEENLRIAAESMGQRFSSRPAGRTGAGRAGRLGVTPCYPSPETPPEAPSAPSTAPSPCRRAQRRARERAEPPGAAGSAAGPPARRAGPRRDRGEDGEHATLPEASTAACCPARWGSGTVLGQRDVLPPDLLTSRDHVARLSTKSRNSWSLDRFRSEVRLLWKRWLGRRSQRGYVNWKEMERLLDRYPLPRPQLSSRVLPA
jgi:hypothetical protein